MGWPEGLPGVRYESRSAPYHLKASNHPLDLSMLGGRLRYAFGLTASGSMTAKQCASPVTTLMVPDAELGSPGVTKRGG